MHENMGKNSAQLKTGFRMIFTERQDGKRMGKIKLQFE